MEVKYKEDGWIKCFDTVESRIAPQKRAVKFSAAV
jgi:hypothetical protein